jgi:hypothetical protein
MVDYKQEGCYIRRKTSLFLSTHKANTNVFDTGKGCTTLQGLSGYSVCLWALLGTNLSNNTMGLVLTTFSRLVIVLATSGTRTVSNEIRKRAKIGSVLGDKTRKV